MHLAIPNINEAMWNLAKKANELSTTCGKVRIQNNLLLLSQFTL